MGFFDLIEFAIHEIKDRKKVDDYYNQWRKDPEGMRMIDDLGNVYLVLDHKLRWIRNMDVYNAIFRDSLDDIPRVNSESLRSSPEGKRLEDIPALVSYPDGSGKIYLIDFGIKRYVTSPATMDRYGFDWNKVVYNYTGQHSEGSPLTA